MSEPAQEHPPTLGYATPDADGLPPWVPEAEELIEKGAPAKKITKYFRKSDDAVKYYIKSMHRRYGPDSLTNTCVLCGQEARDQAIQLEWRVRMPARFMEFRLNDSGPNGTFNTMHSICPSCLVDLLKRTGFLARTRMALSWLSVFAWLAFLALSVLSRAFRARFNWNFPAILAFLGGYLLLFMMTWGVNWMYRRRQSSLTRRPMPRGVKFVRESGIVERHGGRVMVSPFF